MDITFNCPHCDQELAVDQSGAGSQIDAGAQQIGRLTNLMNLTVDTSFYTRYRSKQNPDFGATFPQAVTIQGQPAIPLSDIDIRVLSNSPAAGRDYAATSTPPTIWRSRGAWAWDRRPPGRSRGCRTKPGNEG